MEPVKRYAVDALSPEQIRAIQQLLNRIWPREGVTLEAQIEAFPHTRLGDVKETLFVVWEGDQAIAHAAVFARTIRTADGPLRVLALASVCTAPEHRGEGLGQRVVEAAFALVDEGGYHACLFQTGVPDFYRKLGARTIDNRFTREDAEATAEEALTPWWNPHVMIYPATASWPEGPIDLNGPGF